MRSLEVVAVLALASGCGVSQAMGADSGPTCVPQNGVYSCLGLTLPVCPGEAASNVACDKTVAACMYCFDGAGYTCECADDGTPSHTDGSAWLCVGTGSACR
jgi:hypothetical protein